MRRAQRECQHAAIDAQIERERNRQRQARATATTDVSHQASSVPPIAPMSDITSDFGDELTHQPAAARANREPDADFLLPARRARQQHARDVRARDQQHQADDRHQRRRRSAA